MKPFVEFQILAVLLSFAFLAGMALVAGYVHITSKPPIVVIYEDGGGIQYKPGSNDILRTFPEGTFVWHESMYK